MRAEQSRAEQSQVHFAVAVQKFNQEVQRARHVQHPQAGYSTLSTHFLLPLSLCLLLMLLPHRELVLDRNTRQPLACNARFVQHLQWFCDSSDTLWPAKLTVLLHPPPGLVPLLLLASSHSHSPRPWQGHADGYRDGDGDEAGAGAGHQQQPTFSGKLCFYATKYNGVKDFKQASEWSWCHPSPLPTPNYPRAIYEPRIMFQRRVHFDQNGVSETGQNSRSGVSELQQLTPLMLCHVISSWSE